MCSVHAARVVKPSTPRRPELRSGTREVMEDSKCKVMEEAKGTKRGRKGHSVSLCLGREQKEEEESRKVRRCQRKESPAT